MDSEANAALEPVQHKDIVVKDEAQVDGMQEIAGVSPLLPNKAELCEKIAELIKFECRSLITEALRNVFSPVAEMELICRKELLTEKEVEALFSIPVATLRTERCRNRGPDYIKDGKRVLYPLAGLKEYFGNRIVKPRLKSPFE